MTERLARGVAAVESAFAGGTALIPYLVSGYPDRSRSIACMEAALASGAEMLEIGVPFSDPVADGKVIQAAQDSALARGSTLRSTLETVAELRSRTARPLVLMCYYNPILRMGLARFIEAAMEAGIDGAIVPDLVPDEAWAFIEESRARSFALVFLASPNAPEVRLRRVARVSTGFVYALGLQGVTGERDRVDAQAGPFLERLRAAERSTGTEPRKRIAVGFGVSRPEHFRDLAGRADGVIVGSAVVKRMAESPESVAAFLRGLRERS